MMHTMSRKNMESKAGCAPICFRAHAPWRTPRSGHVPAGTNTSNTSNTTCQTNSNDRSDVSMLPSWRSLAHGAARSKVRDEEGVELVGSFHWSPLLSTSWAYAWRPWISVGIGKSSFESFKYICHMSMKNITYIRHIYMCVCIEKHFNVIFLFLSKLLLPVFIALSS